MVALSWKSLQAPPVTFETMHFLSLVTALVRAYRLISAFRYAPRPIIIEWVAHKFPKQSCAASLFSSSPHIVQTVTTNTSTTSATPFLSASSPQLAADEAARRTLRSNRSQT